MRHLNLTTTLITLNVLAYLVSALLSGSLIELPLEPLVDLGALYGPYVVQQEQWWRLGSAMFLHGGMTHLLMNMVSLYIVGRAAQNFFDAKSYLLLYLFSGLIGGLVSLSVHPQSVGVGASGAIFGMFGALAGFFLAHREKIASHAKAFMKDFTIILGINFAIGLMVPSVDMSAHIGGLVVGVVGGFVVAKNPKALWAFSAAMSIVILLMGRSLLGEYASTLF